MNVFARIFLNHRLKILKIYFYLLPKLTQMVVLWEKNPVYNEFFNRLNPFQNYFATNLNDQIYQIDHTVKPLWN